MTMAKYWMSYYNQNSSDQIPWNHYGDKLFDFLFENYDLPEKGNILDVGTGTGKKAVSLNDEKAQYLDQLSFH